MPSYSMQRIRSIRTALAIVASSFLFRRRERSVQMITRDGKIPPRRRTRLGMACRFWDGIGGPQLVSSLDTTRKEELVGSSPLVMPHVLSRRILTGAGSSQSHGRGEGSVCVVAQYYYLGTYCR